MFYPSLTLKGYIQSNLLFWTGGVEKIIPKVTKRFEISTLEYINSGWDFQLTLTYMYT